MPTANLDNMQSTILMPVETISKGHKLSYMEKDMMLDVDANMVYLRAFALKLTKNSIDAEDLVQETLIKVLDNRGKFNADHGSFRSWITTIMRNLFINDYRKKKHRQTQSFDPMQMVVVESYLGNTENSAVSDLSQQVLHRFINELEDNYKNPFVLYLHGFSYEDISDLLSTEVNTLRTRIFHARRILQQRILKLLEQERNPNPRNN
jgi:RNA polymerase sigma factor (sigma-70 family)